MRNKPALTLIELVLVVTIVSILATAGVLGMFTIRSKQALELSAENLAGAFKQAHLFAREGRDQSDWGVRSDGGKKFSLIKSDLPENVNEVTKFQLEPPAVFDISAAEVWFNRENGGTTANVSWRVKSARAGTAMVEVTTTGVVTVTKE